MANIPELTELQRRLTKATQANAQAICELGKQVGLLVEENRRLVAVLAQMCEAPPDPDEGEAEAAVARYLDGSVIG